MHLSIMLGMPKGLIFPFFFGMYILRVGTGFQVLYLLRASTTLPLAFGPNLPVYLCPGVFLPLLTLSCLSNCYESVGVATEHEPLQLFTFFQSPNLVARKILPLNFSTCR